MHVESLAVYDEFYVPSDYSQTVKKSSEEAAGNLSQVAAVGAICNAASFSTASNEKEGVAVVGDATGMLLARRFIRSLFHVPLRHSDSTLLKQYCICTAG